MHHAIDEEIPPGYDQIRFSPGGALLLPRADAEWMRAEARRRHEAERAEQADRANQGETFKEKKEGTMEQRRRADSEHDKRRAERFKVKRFAARPKPGWYRVLPKLRQLAESMNGPVKSVDKDIHLRREGIVERLTQLGPDRRLAVPKQWRAGLDALEQSLPHFHAPIRSIRNALVLAEATGTPPRVVPQLLLGPPGVGKTHFSHRLTEFFGTAYGVVQFDTPTYGGSLRGLDKAWANSEPGLLFNLIAMGEYANPVILLDELDKGRPASDHSVTPLAQLHGALERETSSRLIDISVDVEFDASLAVYVATANSVRNIEGSILSRMEVHTIEPPDRWQAVDVAQAIAAGVLSRLGLDGKVRFERQALLVLAHLSPRLMARAAEQAVATAVGDGIERVDEERVWREVAPGQGLH